MPQFDPTTFTSQIFWLLITFIALYWVVAKIGVPRIGEVLDQRARVIQDDLDRASQLKADTEEAIATYESAMAAARDQAREHLRLARTEMKEITEARTSELSDKIAKQVEEAEARISLAKTVAMESLTDITTETARDVVNKLAQINPTSDAVEAATTQALKETL
ncbi:MAG TPA: F0F1 ATP synthase subunit B' [Rhodospirillaceae bacterium]|nr:F0F1 ATP synthase subunit B' [Candidatus Neomarinimicrobiota bacterium]HCX15247.1 F0F1 ATP synthase subunit B' [Rhodospirillaceae bacterium]|tara:strand:- start:327 stop:818 length:492 start_codon:yes stop_codon:yes gene_type:complete